MSFTAVPNATISGAPSPLADGMGWQCGVMRERKIFAR